MSKGLKLIGAIVVGVATGFIFGPLAGLYVATTAASLLLAKKPNSVVPRDIIVRGGTQPETWIYGEAMAGGLLAYINQKPIVGEDENYELWLVIVHASHRVEGISDIMYESDLLRDGVELTWSGNIGTVNSGPWYAADATHEASRVYRRLGQSNQVLPLDLVSAFPADLETTSPSSFRLRGRACTIHRFQIFDESEATFRGNQPSNIRALVKGRLVYDWDLDSSPGNDPTNVAYLAWSDNPVKCAVDYMRNAWGFADSRFDWDHLATQSAKADVLVSVPPSASPENTEKRYTCNGVISLGDSHNVNMAKILSSCMGYRATVNGLIRIYVGDDQASTVTLDETDVIGRIAVRTALPRAERYNRVMGTYYSPDASWAEAEFLPVENAGFVTRDNGEEITTNISLPMVTSEYQAQRIAFKHLQQSDQQLTVEVPLRWSGMRLTPGTYVSFTYAKFSWSSKLFRCERVVIAESGVPVRALLREDSASAWDDPTVVQYTTRNAQGKITKAAAVVPPPTSMTVTPVVNGNWIKWVTPAAESYDYFRIYAAPTSSWGSPQVAEVIGEVNGDYYFHQLPENTTRYYWVVSVRDNEESLREPNSDTSDRVGTSLGAEPLKNWIKTGYASFEKRVDADFITDSVDTVATVDATIFYHVLKSLKVTVNGTGGAARADFTPRADENIEFPAARRWMVVAFIREDSGGDAALSVRFGLKNTGSLDKLSTNTVTVSAQDTWEQHAFEIDLTDDEVNTIGWTRFYISKNAGTPTSPIHYNVDHVVMLDVTDRPDITTSTFPTEFIAGTGGRSVTQGLPYQPLGASDITELTTLRDVGEKLDESVSVLDVGADQTGVVDATALIQSAIDDLYTTVASQRRRMILRLPRGDYIFSALTVGDVEGTGAFTRGRLIIQGDGIGNTRLICNAAAGDAITYSSGFIEFRDFTLTSDGVSRSKTVGSGHGIVGDRGDTVGTLSVARFVNVVVQNQPGDGFHHVNPELTSHINTRAVNNGGDGIHYNGAVGAGGIACYQQNCRWTQNGGYGIHNQGVVGSLFDSPECLSNEGGWQIWSNAKNNHFKTVDIESPDYTTGTNKGIYLSGQNSGVHGGLCSAVDIGIELAGLFNYAINVEHTNGGVGFNQTAYDTTNAENYYVKVQRHDASTTRWSNVNLTAMFTPNNPHNGGVQIEGEYHRYPTIGGEVDAFTVSAATQFNFGSGGAAGAPVPDTPSPLTVTGRILHTHYYVTLASNANIQVPSVAREGQYFEITFIQDGTGGRTVTFINSGSPETIRWEHDFSNDGNVAGAMTTIVFRRTGQGGITRYVQVGAQRRYGGSVGSLGDLSDVDVTGAGTHNTLRKDASGDWVDTAELTVDPAGAVVAGYAGVRSLQTRSYGESIHGTTAGDPTTPANNDTELSIQNTSAAVLATLGFPTSTTLILKNYNHGSGIRLRAEDAAGLTQDLAWGDPDADFKMYQAGAEVARTLAAASGGLEANNTLTGAGFERVLTTSDAYAHPNHTGDVTSTGDGAQVLEAQAINGQTALGVGAVQGTDEFLVYDISDLSLKKLQVNQLIDGLNAELTLTSPQGIADTDEMMISDGGVTKKVDMIVLAEYFQATLTLTGYTHPNHTGDVTSVADGAQTLEPVAISGKTNLGAAAVQGADEFLIHDASDTTVLKALEVNRLINGLNLALTSGLASDDELMVSDTDALAVKRMDISVLTAYLEGALTGPFYTHPNHSGDVTSVADGAQTLEPVAISGKTNLGVAGVQGGDSLLVHDLTGPSLKELTFNNLLPGLNNSLAALAAADLFMVYDDNAAAIAKMSTTTLETYLNANLAFDNDHPHTGDVTGSGALTIANNAVTNAKAADMAQSTIKGRASGAGTGDPTDLTAAQARTILNVADGANNYSHPNHSGDVTSVGDGAQTIANDAVTNAKAANMAQSTIKGRASGAGTGDPTDLTAAQVRTIINVADGANNYSHPNHTGDVTSSGDGATTAQPALITGKANLGVAAIQGSDEFLIYDVSATALKRLDYNNIIDGCNASIASGLADTDEMLISDAGVTKRVDLSVLKSYFNAP